MPTLDWLNRDAAFQIAAGVPYRLLEEVSAHEASAPTLKAPPHKGSEGEKAESRQDLFSGLEPTSDKGSSEKLSTEAAAQSSPAATVAPTRDNLLIQGDNLEALKALLPLYRGQVKCIFIDPPYNTKSAFEHYDDNLEHAQWLTMMLPRLQLLRELLSEDGSIWVHLDDNESHYNKVLMDEVFGRTNFLANIVWQKSYAVRSNAEFFSTSTEHIVIYARNRSRVEIGSFRRSDEQRARFGNPDGDKRGDWQSVTMTISLLSGARGRQFEKTGFSPNIYEVQSPSGAKFLPPARRCWSRSETEFKRLDADGRLWWGKNGDSPPRLKMFLSETEDAVIPVTLWASGELFGFNQDGIRELRAIGLEFPTPKPERLLSQVLEIATNPNDLVLDSFLGSGTTAAVAQKMGRRWIGIEMGEHAHTHCLPRLEKVLDGEQGGISKAVNWQGGGSFRFLRLGAPVFDEAGAIHPDVRFSTLAAFVWMQETGTPLATGQAGSSPFLGTHNGVAYYLLYNGILGDRRPQGGNVLTSPLLAWLDEAHSMPATATARVIYGEATRLGPARLNAARITFKQIPYDVGRG